MTLKSTWSIILFLLYRSALTARSLSLSILNFNVSNPFENTPIKPSLSARPHDPLEINSDWDGPGFITLTFSNYGADIRLQLALYCVSLAIKDAWDGHRSVWNQAIGKSELLYTNTHTPTEVTLSVLPAAAMTWNMLYWSMLAVRQFARDFESMAFDYEVEVTGVLGLVARGNLSVMPEFGS